MVTNDHGSEPNRPRVGLIGLGVMGRIFAGHLLGANCRVVGHDSAARGLEPLVGRGLTLAGSAGDVGAQSEVVLLSLPSPDALRDAMLGEHGVLQGARRDTLVIDLSTVDPFTCRELYRAARERGVAFLEAPVSGGEPLCAGMEGAKAANITFMVAGDEEAFERAKPVLGILGKHWFYLGPAGTGAIVKLISNLIAGLNNLVAIEGFILGAAAGIPWQTLIEVFRHTDARSYQMMDYMLPRMQKGDFEPGFSVDLQYKDHRLAAELAHQLRVPLPLNAFAMQVYQELRAKGRGGRDFTDALNLIGEWAGVDFARPRKAGPPTES